MLNEQFLEIVGLILEEAGRGGLPEDSPMRDIIEVRPDDKVLQVLAGPGSGKTEALTWRVLYEVMVNGTPSDQVMVTTFTRRAATELQVRLVERADALLEKCHENGIAIPDPHVHDLRVGTLHSLCDSLLLEFDDQYKQSGTQLIDDHEALVRAARNHSYGFVFPKSNIAREIVGNQQLNFLFLPPWVDPSIDYFASMMRRSRLILDVIGQLTETWIPRRTEDSVIGIESVHGPNGLTTRLERLLERWVQHLDQNNILDFRTVQRRFWERQEAIVAHVKHVFVDEFQDNNPIQFDIHLGWLRSEDARLTVVGDDDQAIYRFRGSDADCFASLAPRCRDLGKAYRRAALETNYRSTKNIVRFAGAFREGGALATQSMPKSVQPSSHAVAGEPIRLLTGSWSDICETVAHELDQLGTGQIPRDGQASPSACILLFSTSERVTKDWIAPAVGLRAAIERRGMRIYNPRNKQAATKTSEVGMLLGLLSYLIDPISLAPVGANGRRVEVWASIRQPRDPGERKRWEVKRDAAISAPPSFNMSDAHADFQKGFRKSTGRRNIENCTPERQCVLDYLDELRARLAAGPSEGLQPRMSLAGVIARLLALPFFRNSGFTERMFRQALFTQLLEANVAPTRLTHDSLDMPLEVTLSEKGKYVWADRFWWLLNYFGAFLQDSDMDDLEVAAFQENAVPVITFHQAKGLEFDHVYVAATGREPSIAPALRTRLFSGESVNYKIAGGLETDDSRVCAMAEADRDREVYVAITRAKHRLTILHDKQGQHFMQLHKVIQNMFHGASSAHALNSAVEVREWCNE